MTLEPQGSYVSTSRERSTVVLGLGLDLVDVETVALAIARDASCAAGWCTEAEVAALGPRATDAHALAGRIAAKEAVTKALGTGFAGEVAWQDVELVAEPTGQLSVLLSGGARTAAEAAGVARVLVSITHTAKTAGACALALANESS